jgi:5-formyltetrahydrofolate cyclo-ligase
VETKTELRQRFKALRDRVPIPERLLASERICRQVAALCAARRITSVGAFWPLGSEVDLRPLVASQPHISFYFPRIAALEPPRLTWGTQPLEPGAWGLLEPFSAPYDLPPVKLLLVPGLAFAPNGHRLGYGKGFYDAVLDGMPGFLTLGVGFRFQRCPGLPAEARDRPVQGLVDEDGITWIEAGANPV